MIYAFEEIGPDLSRPPLAARRALLGAGVAVPLDTWCSLPLPARQAITHEGTKDTINELGVKNAVSPVLKRVRFMGPVKDPSRDAIPQVLVDALRTLRPLTLGEWQSLRPIDRYTLVALSANSRLLYRAIEEMTSGPASTLSGVKLRPWIGTLAHAEVTMARAALGEVAGGRLQGGKALVLARAAGVRAARGAHEIIDGYAEKYVGPVELDARLDAQLGGYVWQAHVSSSDGEFLAGPSVLAAATAAVALRDAVAAYDPAAGVGGIALREAMWTVGSAAFGDEATVSLPAKVARASLSGPVPAAPPSGNLAEEKPTRRGVPVWVALVLVFSTLLAFTAAGLTVAKSMHFANIAGRR